MLIVFGKVDESLEGTVSVEQHGAGWRLSAAGWSFEFDASLAPSKPDVALLALNRRGQPRMVWGREMFNERAGIAFAMGRNDIALTAPFIAAFAVEEGGTPHCFVMTGNTYVGDLQCEVVQGGQSFIDVFHESVPALRAYIQKAVAKRVLLGSVLYADSLAALEAHVDLLTQVVARVVPLLPESERPSVAQALADIVAADGVNALHTQEKLLADITSQKQKLRDLQRAYIAARNGDA